MPAKFTPNFGFAYGWDAGESPGVTHLDALRTVLDTVLPKGFAVDARVTVGLSIGFLPAILPNASGAYVLVSPANLTLTANSVCYIERTPAGVFSFNTGGWSVGKLPIAIATTNASTITAVQDFRPITASATAAETFLGPAGNITSTNVQSGMYELDALITSTTGALQTSLQSWTTTQIGNHASAQIDGATTPIKIRGGASVPASGALPTRNMFINTTSNTLFWGDPSSNPVPLQISVASVIGLPDMSTIEAPPSDLAVTYDSAGRLAQVDYHISGSLKQNIIAYGADGQVSSITYKSDAITTRIETYNYNVAGDFSGYAVT